MGAPGNESASDTPGSENAEAETSGLRAPEGTARESSPPRGETGATDPGEGSEPPRGPGAFAGDATPPPVFDE